MDILIGSDQDHFYPRFWVVVQEKQIMSDRVFPEIDAEVCTGCGDCIVACKPGALVMVADKAVLANPDRCEYDGQCEPVCPAGAIQLPYMIVLG